MNIVYWFTQNIIIISLVIFLGRYKPKTLEEILPIFPVLMNIFITKIIDIYSYNIPSGDALAVAFSLGINIINIQFGKQRSNKIIEKATKMTIAACLLCHIHSLTIPIENDITSLSHNYIFNVSLRVFASSILSFYLSQKTENAIFNYLKKNFIFAYIIASLVAQFLDTTLFTILVFFNTKYNMLHIILWSMFIKLFIWFISLIGIKIYEKQKSSSRF